jgi:MtN3 and saliva related transmembrane protein
MIDGITILGLVATLFIISAQIPQIYKSYKTKSTGDLSLWMILWLITGVGLWLLYGLLRPDYVIVISNTLGEIALITLLALKLKYK